MSIDKGRPFQELLKTTTIEFKKEFDTQTNMNQALIDLNTRVDNMMKTITNEPSPKEEHTNQIKEFSLTITEEMSSLVKRTASLKELKTTLEDTLSYTKRAPLDPVSLATISYLDPTLAHQVTTLFDKAMSGHKELTQHYAELEALSQAQQNTISMLSKNIRALNKAIEAKGWLSTLCEKISNIFKNKPKKKVVFDLSKNTEKLFLKTNPANTAPILITPTSQEVITPSHPSSNLANAAIPSPSSRTCRITRGSLQTPLSTPSHPTKKKKTPGARELKNLNIDPTLDLSAPRTTRSASRK
jgi:hypothetical protein